MADLSALVTRSRGRGNIGRRSYQTSFPLTEGILSEGGIWVAPSANWTKLRTVPGICYGNQTGDNGTDDSIAHLSGSWSADQDVSGVVHIGTRPGDFSELELLLHFDVNLGHGYECYMSVVADGNKYAHITRWDGWNGGTNQTIFTDLVSLDDTQFSQVNNGDVVRATIVAGVINVYLRGSLLMGPHDINGDATKYLTGAPGLGHFSQTKASTSEWGWASYTAQEYAA